MSGTSNTPPSGATGKTDFTGIVNALQMLAQAIGQNGKALDAIKAALPGSLPAPSPGNALDMVRINAGGTAYEVRTPAQVASDIGSPQPATVAPLVDGTAAVGTSLLYARQDHVHPLPTPTGWQTIASYTPSAVASQAIPLPSGFRRYRMTLQGVTVNTSNAILNIAFSTNSGSTYIASGYTQFGLYNSNTTPAAFDQSGTSGLLAPVGLFSGGAATLDGVFDISPGSASLVAMCNGQASCFSSGSLWTRGQMSNALAAGASINQVKVTVSTGTFSGTFILEGLV